MNKKIVKVFDSICIALIAAMAGLLVVSMLPVTGGFKVLTVLSGSMEPAIHTGSIVVVAPQKEYNIGDVITFGLTGKAKAPTTHRINDVKIVGGQTVFITKGDANNAPDALEVAASEIKGRVLFTVPLIGFMLNFIRQPIGFALAIIVPAVLLILEEIKKIRSELKKNGRVATS